MATENFEETDVVICGCGPTGAMLAAYLGRMSIPHIVVEKEPEITTDPRGIALDEDGIRMLQGLGIYDAIFSEIGTCMQDFKFIGGTEEILDKKPFLEMSYGTTEGGTGHIGYICHKQPVLEKHLRSAMTSSKFCQFRPNSSICDVREEGDHVFCRYRNASGEHTIKSRFLVGADGKTGFTRKNYLEPLGVRMEQAHESFYDETWVALNWEISLPNESTHPDFPLWKLGYTPDQVYEAFFPPWFSFICNPDRPAVCGRFGLPSDRLWRFEFVVQAGEDGEQMSEPENIRRVVYPYITHQGSRYGLPSAVQFPEDCIRVLRSRPFRFSARSCNKWSHGRLALCGDSAHVFPPFGGQGIASGFRDAVSLAWRLAFLCRRQASAKSNHEDVLTGWYIERKQQLESSLATTIESGNFVNERNPIKIFLRDWLLYFMQFVPAWRRELRLGRRKDGLVQYEYSPGLPFDPNHGGGICLPQVYCKSAQDFGGVLFSDDVIFDRYKKGMFQLLVYLPSMSGFEEAWDTVSQIDKFSQGEFHPDEATFIVEQVDTMGAHKARVGSVYYLATGDEFAKSALCRGRPEPRYYDSLDLRRMLKGNRFALVRPDRFVYGACNNLQDLEHIVGAAVKYLKCWGFVSPGEHTTSGVNSHT